MLLLAKLLPGVDVLIGAMFVTSLTIAAAWWWAETAPGAPSAAAQRAFSTRSTGRRLDLVSPVPGHHDAAAAICLEHAGGDGAAHGRARDGTRSGNPQGQPSGRPSRRSRVHGTDFRSRRHARERVDAGRIFRTCEGKPEIALRERRCAAAFTGFARVSVFCVRARRRPPPSPLRDLGKLFRRLIGERTVGRTVLQATRQAWMIRLARSHQSIRGPDAE